MEWIGLAPLSRPETSPSPHYNPLAFTPQRMEKRVIHHCPKERRKQRAMAITWSLGGDLTTVFSLPASTSASQGSYASKTTRSSPRVRLLSWSTAAAVVELFRWSLCKGNHSLKFKIMSRYNKDNNFCFLGSQRYQI